MVNWADGDAATQNRGLPNVSDDAADEADETVGLTLSNPTGGSTLGTATATVTIVDNDLPPEPVPQTTSVHGKYGKGSMDGTFLVVLLSLAACVSLLRLRAARRAAALAAAVLATQAQAADGWYVGIRAGAAESTQSASDIERGLAARGHDVTVAADDRQPTYSLLAGYRFANGLALESSLVELGEYEVAVHGTTTNPAALLADTESLLADGCGVSAALAWHLPLGKNFELTPRAGVYYWDSEKQLRSDATRSRSRETGVDLTGPASRWHGRSTSAGCWASAGKPGPRARATICVPSMRCWSIASAADRRARTAR